MIYEDKYGELNEDERREIIEKYSAYIAGLPQTGTVIVWSDLFEELLDYPLVPDMVKRINEEGEEESDEEFLARINAIYSGSDKMGRE